MNGFTLIGKTRLAFSSRFRNVFIFILLLAADRLTKCWALSAFEPGDGAGKFFSLGLHFNPGVAFSLLSRHSELSFAIAMTGFALLTLVCLWSGAFRSTPGMTLLWAGAAANLADRLLYGYVVDWICAAGLYFNLADLWLCIGCLLIFQGAGPPGPR